MRRCLLLLLVVAASQAVLGSPAAAAVPAWTTYRHDAARSGIDPDSTSPVTPAKAWQTPQLDGEVYGQPLVYGAHVYVTTENDSIYELDAATGAVVWFKHLATPEPPNGSPGGPACGDIAPSIGITSTPVIDPTTNRIYAVGAVSLAGAIHHELFALGLSSGQPVAGFPITVDPPFPAGGDPVNQLQRVGLALDNGRILIGYGGNGGDCSTYWGWLVSAPTDGSTGLSSFQVDKGYLRGALWASGNAPAIDAAGNVFVATGNGTGNTTSDPAFGDSVVKLNAAASPLDWWAPVDWQTLDLHDADLGSSMPTLLPHGLVFQSGKDGNGYLLNGANLGHVSAPVAEASGICSSGSFGGSVYDPANATIYAACRPGLAALVLGSGSPPSLAVKPGFAAPSGAIGPPIIAGGLVWATSSSGTLLYGMDPSSGKAVATFPIPVLVLPINHFSIPSAGGGRLFVASGTQVTAFTIATPPPPTRTSTTLASSANPARAGQAVVLTAAVAPTPDAGTVKFTDGGVAISGCSSVAVSPATAGRAVCHTAFTHPGKHQLAASYSGDAYYVASVSAGLTETVRGADAPGGGGLTGGSAGPVISHASISPRRFTAAHRSMLRLNLTEAAQLTVAITQGHRGHVVRDRCSARAQRGRSCRVRVTLMRLHFRANSGRSAFKLRVRRLSPGRYTALVSATDAAGLRSTTVRITFTILRPRR